MSISRTLQAYLDHERVHYDVLPHPEAFRAVAIAQILHTPEKEMAKVIRESGSAVHYDGVTGKLVCGFPSLEDCVRHPPGAARNRGGVQEHVSGL
jgi:hypothetical protein